MASMVKVGSVRHLLDPAFIFYRVATYKSIPTHSVPTCENKRWQFMDQRFSFISIPLSLSSYSFNDVSLFNRHSIMHTKICPSFSSISGTWRQHVLTARMKSYEAGDELSAVETQLKRHKVGAESMKRQLELLRSLCMDVSEPSPELIAKLNCEPKASAEEIYTLALSVLEANKYVAEKSTFLLHLAASLFGYGGVLGDHNALYTYAQLLRMGQGVEMNQPKAVELLSELSVKGHPYAQFTLGGMYYAGSGVKQNYQRAYTLYKVSAQNYIPQAYNILGNMHRFGHGVKEDINLAVDYYQKGCTADDPFAHLSLAHCYSHGKGVVKSLENAFKSYLIASKSDNPVAVYNVGTHYFSGYGVAQNLEKAREYYERASALGFAPAQVNLGNMYLCGVGVAKDVAKAKELFALAADRDENAARLLEKIEKEEMEKDP